MKPTKPMEPGGSNRTTGSWRPTRPQAPSCQPWVDPSDQGVPSDRGGKFDVRSPPAQARRRASGEPAAPGAGHGLVPVFGVPGVPGVRGMPQVPRCQSWPLRYPRSGGLLRICAPGVLGGQARPASHLAAYRRPLRALAAHGLRPAAYRPGHGRQRPRHRRRRPGGPRPRRHRHPVGRARPETRCPE